MFALSLPASFISAPQWERGKKDLGSGWSCVSQKVKDDKKQPEGRAGKSQICVSCGRHRRGILPQSSAGKR